MGLSGRSEPDGAGDANPRLVSPPRTGHGAQRTLATRVKVSLTQRFERVRTLAGGRAGLSNPVIVGFAIQGIVLTVSFGTLAQGLTWLQAVAATACSLALSCSLLFVARKASADLNWERPRLGFVVGILLLASTVRSVMSSAMIASFTPTSNVTSDPMGRTIVAVSIAMVVTLGIACAVQLGRDRGMLVAALLAEQARLRELAESTEDERTQAEVALRMRASELLEPTIAEIRGLLDGKLSGDEAARISARIQVAVHDVVRPASRELAMPPPMTLAELPPLEPTRINVFTDRMDVPRSIRPTAVLLVAYLALVPGALLLNGVGWWTRFGVGWSLAFWFIVLMIKRAWPERFRSMTVIVGLGVILAVFLAGNVGYQMVLDTVNDRGMATDAWGASTLAAIVIRTTVAMVVAVLTMLGEHGQRNRAAIAELNTELAALVARRRREIWLLHRSVALAVHGPLQSALVSTAMRLSSVPCSQATVDDAKRRLVEALSAIERNSHGDVSVDDALTDLCDLWRGVVRMSVGMSPEAQAVLAADSGLRRCVIEVCREAASNAIRHGGAGEVVITLTAIDGRIEVRVRDDGQGIDPGAIEGLGSSMLDDTCLRWNLSDVEGGGAELVAILV